MTDPKTCRAETVFSTISNLCVAVKGGWGTRGTSTGITTNSFWFLNSILKIKQLFILSKVRIIIALSYRHL